MSGLIGLAGSKSGVIGASSTGFVKLKDWTTAGTTTSIAMFPGVFTDNSYQTFRIQYSINSTTNTFRMHMSFLTGTDTAVSAGEYYGSLFYSKHNTTGFTETSSNDANHGLMAISVNNSTAYGGTYGEMRVHSVTAPIILGDDTNRGAYYRPYINGNSHIYAGAYGVARYDIRFNQNQEAAYYSGFRIYLRNSAHSADANFSDNSWISCYGMRH